MTTRSPISSNQSLSPDHEQATRLPDAITDGADQRTAILLVGFGEVKHSGNLASYNTQALNLLVSKFVPIPKWLYPLIGHLVGILNEHEYWNHRFTSPYNEIFEQQRLGIEQRLQQRWGRQIQVFKAFSTCENWFPEKVLAEIQQQGFRRVILYPLLLIDSIFTTGITIEQMNRGLSQIGDRLPEEAPWLDSLRYIPSFYDQPGYTKLVAQLIQERIQKKLAFAHLPSRIGIVLINQGSPKDARGFTTGIGESEVLYERVRSRLVNQFPLISIGWYNHAVPFSSWPSPTVAQAAKNLVQLGASAVVLMPVGSPADNRETILDLDYIVHDLERRHPGVTYLQMNCVNDHPDFLDMAADWANSQICTSCELSHSVPEGL